MTMPAPDRTQTFVSVTDTVESSRSAVAWPAIFAGAVAATFLSLILLSLGSGIGLSSVSPWTDTSDVAITFTVTTAVWLIVVQWLSSGLGGYLTGRLRTKWSGVHTDEVFFRDTAHGFMSWALAAVIGAGLLASTTAAVVGHVASQSRVAQSISQHNAYVIDNLYRRAPVVASADGVAASYSGTTDQAVRDETNRIFLMSLNAGEFAVADREYLVQTVMMRAGVSQGEAEKRVDDTVTHNRELADKARKAGAALSFFTFFSMLIGAFIASIAAAIGGRHRDEY